MFHAKNYETASTFVKIMQTRTPCITLYHAAVPSINFLHLSVTYLKAQLTTAYNSLPCLQERPWW